jgi:hypothetical protein
MEFPSGMAAQGGTLFVATYYTNDQFFKVPETAMADAGTIYAQTSYGSPALIVVDAQNAYFSVGSSYVYYAALLATPPVTPVAVMSGLGDFLPSLAVDTTNVYISDAQNNAIYACPFNGSFPCGATYSTFAQGFANGPNVVYSDQTNVWFSDNTSLYKCPASGPCGTNPPAFTTSVATAIVVDVAASYVYWATATGVMRCSSTGATCASPTTVATIANATALAQTSTTLYIESFSSTYLLAK